MPLMERVYSVLIVSASEKFTASLRGMLPESGYQPVCEAESVSGAQRKMQERAFDIVIINAPLTDDFGNRLAVDVCQSRSCAALLFVRGELYDEVYARVFAHGVFTLRRPASAQTVLQAFDWLRAARERLRGFEKKTLSMEEKMAEIRVVNHAKWALIESRGMTENEAHKYIEKQAMDRCVSRRDIAEDILRDCK